MDPESLRRAWEWAISDEAANFWQIMIAAATVLTTPFLTIGLLQYVQDQRRDRVDAVEKRKAEEEELKVKREEIDGDLVRLYFGILDDLMKYPEADKHDQPLSDPMHAKRQQHIYTKAVMSFSTAFRRLHGQEDSGLGEMWSDWEDEINDWVSGKPNFRNRLVATDLLKGESKAFQNYMIRKVKQFSQTPQVAIGSGPMWISYHAEHSPGSMQ